MNKRILTSVTTVAMMVGLVTPVLAQSPSPSPSATPTPIKQLRKDFREEVKKEKQTLRENIASKSQQLKQAIKERLSDVRKARITKWWDNADKRLQKLIDRETKLADKVQARLNKFKAAGKDTAQAQKDLDAVRIAIKAAQTSLDEASVKVPGIINDNTPADAFKKLHDLHKGVVDKIRAAHQKMVQVIASTRGMSGTPPAPTVSTSASPTVSPTTSPTP